MNETKVLAHHLYKFTHDVFLSLGYDTDKAAHATNVLHYADLRGHDTHGVANLSRLYVPSVLNEKIRLNAKPKWIQERGACALLDADGALGLLVAQQGMERALTNAREYGIASTAITNSTHFGAAGFYSEMALQKQMIGFSMTNLGKEPVANPLGSKQPLLGTNPISFAAGSNNKNVPFVLDMSTSVIASGKIRHAARTNQKVPKGWLLNSGGIAIEEPDDYINGEAYIPMLGGDSVEHGGHKGLGLGLMVEILCGVLTGAHNSSESGTPGRNSIGHFFIAIDPTFFRKADTFNTTLEELLLSITGATTHQKYPPLLYPGLPESKTLSERLSHGIPIDNPLLIQLDQLSTELKIPVLTRNEKI